jgi:potassium-transporting ATPase KdpC subunit
MKKNFITAILFTAVTTILFGVLYPLDVTGLTQALVRDKADGQLIKADGRVVGSRIIGQEFNAPGYFHSRPSNAGSGYEATCSSGSNYGPTNKVLIDRVHGHVEKLRAENSKRGVPVDMVTASGSGLDPDISPAAAESRFPVSREYGMCLRRSFVCSLGLTPKEGAKRASCSSNPLENSEAVIL